MHTHTHCASDYGKQLKFLEKKFIDEIAKAEEKENEKNEFIYKTYGIDFNTRKKHEENKSLYPNLKMYKNKIQYENDKYKDNTKLEDDVLIQLPWSPIEVKVDFVNWLQMPSEEEIKRRHELRKEQGKRLKDFMQKKRDQKIKQMESEYYVNYLNYLHFQDLERVETLQTADPEEFQVHSSLSLI
jgi:hypothetical protein